MPHHKTVARMPESGMRVGVRSISYSVQRTTPHYLSASTASRPVPHQLALTVTVPLYRSHPRDPAPIRGAIASDSNIPQNNATARKSPAPLLFFPIWYFLKRTFFGSRDMALLRRSSSISGSAPFTWLGRVRIGQSGLTVVLAVVL